MAKASVELKCSECGETYTATKTCHNRKEADNWESWVRDQPNHRCGDCYAAEMKARREQEKSIEAAKNAEAVSNCPLGLPELVGSDKQIKWATDIRSRVIANLTKQGIRWDVLATRAFPEAYAADIDAELVKLLDQSAKSWIEKRGTSIFTATVD